MQSNSFLRSEARRHLDGVWGTFVLMTFLLYLIQYVCQLPSQFADAFKANIDFSLVSNLSGVSIILTLLLLPMNWSYSVSFLKNHRGATVDFGDLFVGYKQFTRIFGTLLLQALYTLLWTLLLIIPGIVKSMSYALTAYVLHDHPELQYNAAIERSMSMMEGNKMRLFLLCLSFLGWAILALFTCGIGFLWLAPYVQASMTAFYEDVRADYEANYAANDAHQADYASMNAPGSKF